MTYSYECDRTFSDIDEGEDYERHFLFEVDIDPPDPGRTGKYPEDCEPSYSGSADIIKAFIANDNGEYKEITKELSEYFTKSELQEIEEEALESVLEKDYSPD
jgi:hypothetical protein